MTSHEKIFTLPENKRQKLEIIAKILDYPQYKDESIEKKVERFDYLYDKELSELIIYSKVYK